MHSLIKELAVRQMSSLRYCRTRGPVCVMCETGVRDTGMQVCSIQDRCVGFGTSGMYDAGTQV